MTLYDQMKAKRTLSIIAAKEGCSVKDIRQSIQASIDDAWNRAWTPGNLQAQVTWQRIFPGGRKPTVEEFIIAMAHNITAKEGC